jgi:nucleoid DNA-binding protein
MRYKIKKETKPTLHTFGKYKAVAVHNQEIDGRTIARDACVGTTLSPAAMEGLMMAVGHVVMRRLRMGDKVRLKGFGLLKLEIESDKVDDPKQFRAKNHIRGVRLHFIPESEGGSPELYKDITFERAKGIDF